MKRYSRLLSILLAGTLMFLSCDSDDEFDPGTAPEIPPLSTMVMDVENFTNGTTNPGGRNMTKTHWAGAALQVGFWNTILALNLALPVAAYGVTINEQPEFDRDRGLWIWSLDFNFAGGTYTLELTGQIIANQVEWNMYLSQDGGFQDVWWYTGTMQMNGTSGYWILKKNATEATDFLRIDWQIENEEVGSIKYEIIETGADEIGSYIECGKMTGGDYNVFYTIEITSPQRKAAIEWNDQTGAGRVEYDDSGVYYCWDTNFDDIDCN